jgi:hypothetical protein
VVGAAIRPDRVPPSVKHDEGVQVDNAATLGMPKITPSVNFDVYSYWNTTITSDLMSARSVARTEQQCTSSTCLLVTGQPA